MADNDDLDDLLDELDSQGDLETSQQVLSLRTESRRYDKPVTIIEGFDLTKSEIESTASDLRVRSGRAERSTRVVSNCKVITAIASRNCFGIEGSTFERPPLGSGSALPARYATTASRLRRRSRFVAAYYLCPTFDDEV